MAFFRKVQIKIKKTLAKLGPGIITGASDDDPSGIATYSQAGASFGHTLLWLSVFTLPLTIGIQEICGRIGLVTGSGLAKIIKTHYSRTFLYFIVGLLFFANALNIGADLGAMASSVRLFVPIPFWIILITLASTTVLLEIYIPYDKYKQVLKYFALSLVAYIITFFITKPDYLNVLFYSFVPHVVPSEEFFLTMVAVVGTTISPYLFFWQTGEEVEELVEKGAIKHMGQIVKRIYKREISGMRLDTHVGMLISNMMMFFIIGTTASTLNPLGITTVETATDAATALRPLGGDLSYVLFVLGILGTGFLSIPVLAGSASYAIAESFGLKEGLFLKFSKAKAFYIVIALSTFIGIFVNLSGIKPFLLLFYSAIINGIASPFILVAILLIANNKNIMKSYTNGKISNSIGIFTTILMFAGILGLLIFSFT